ncbi:hypothetical protein [Spirosoma utsteinense]|uniref:Glycosyltransferase RgtA/B/C/D-like domain-containing protein n=1 Tax=Spirosoma utsteinense TaxID=2585773 RepID=A0ABR6W2M9_9BACT|nr:hypothetical protein [Spirosoma utsteinense]MBC3784984.1 hypothetical protein [Spirosoma utsteinense]MBC3790408.1 hypothetical protein [Spirosoma utsteinense]
MKRFIWPTVCFLCIVVYYTVIVENSQNIPFADDLAIMANLYDIHVATTPSDVVATLLSYHNEHRILLPRLVIMALAKLNGGIVDIQWWIWAGNSLLLLIGYVFYRVFANYQKPFIYFVPVVLLLFQPLAAELTYWGMASLQNIGVLVLSAITIYLISGDGSAAGLSFRGTRNLRRYLISGDGSSAGRLLVSFLLTGAAMLTGANGILLLLPVALVLLVKRCYKQAVGWLVTGGFVVELYWTGFIPGVHSGSAAKTTPDVLDSGLSFLGMMGAFVESQRYDYVSVIVGVVFLILVALAVSPKIRALIQLPVASVDRQTIFVLAFSSFILLTMAAIAVNRHLDAILHVSRYKIYPVLLLICLYLLCLDRFRWRVWSIRPVVLLCLIANGIAYKRYLPIIGVHQAYLTLQLNNWLLYRSVDAPTPFIRQYYEQRWTNMYRLGLYKPPTRRYRLSNNRV